MAVFQQELNWSTFQEKQLDTLESIRKSLDTSLRIGQYIASTMNTQANAIDAIAHATENSAKNIEAMTREWTGSAVEFTSRMGEATSNIREFNVNIGSTDEPIKKFKKNVEESGSSFSQVIKDVGSNLLHHLGGLSGIAKEIDNFSAASNQMIRNTGMRGNDVRNFRSGIMSIVSDLNEVTGNAFSPMKSYNDIIAISQGVTSNLTAIEEMARPLLLTQESLDVNISSVAELMNKFYTRYNFSSSNMESIMDEIRGNTAGNSANAQATLENIKSLEDWIGYTAKNDNAKRDEMLEAISHYTSWLESMNVDSKAYTDYINAIAYGDYSDNLGLVNILARTGTSTIEATNMARDGRFEELTEKLMRGISDIFTKVKDSPALGMVLDNYGLTRSTAMDAYNVINSDNFIGLAEFIEEQKGKSTMEELVEDKYVSVTDQINHWLEQIYAKLADAQEILGIGLSDVITWLSILSIRGGSGSGGSSSGGLMSTLKSIGTKSAAKGIATSAKMGSAGGVMTKASSGLAKVAGVGGGLGGTAMLAGGVAAGGALAVDGVSTLLDSDADAVSKSLSGVEAAAGVAGAGSLLALGVSNPVGWVALAVGGIAFLGKKAYEEAEELSGNAKAVQSHLEGVENSLKDEINQRMYDLNNLAYNFEQLDDLEDQRNLLESSGIFRKEELIGATEEQMRDLIDKYKEANTSMSAVIDQIIGLAEDKYVEEQDDQLKELIDYIRSADLTDEQRTDIAQLLKLGTTDPDMIARINAKIDDDGLVHKGEMTDILNGGYDNWLWDSTNIKDKGLGIGAMRAIASYLNLPMEIKDYDEATVEAAARAVTEIMEAIYMDRSSEEIGDLWQGYVDEGLTSEILRIYREQLDPFADRIPGYEANPQKSDAYKYFENTTLQPMPTEQDTTLGLPVVYSKAKQDQMNLEALRSNLPGYDVGTNYVARDHVAVLHEGEAVVPKKYNPAVNSKESRELADNFRATQEESNRLNREYMSSFVTELREIRKFLADWKIDKDTKDTVNSVKEGFKRSSEAIQQYLPTYL